MRRDGQIQPSTRRNYGKNIARSNLDRYVISDVAYKPGCPVDIIEESQPIEVAKRLVRAKQARRDCDRATIIQLVKRTYGRTFEYEIANGESRGDVSSTSAAMGNPLSSYSA